MPPICYKLTNVKRIVTAERGMHGAHLLSRLLLHLALQVRAQHVVVLRLERSTLCEILTSLLALLSGRYNPINAR